MNFYIDIFFFIFQFCFGSTYVQLNPNFRKFDRMDPMTWKKEGIASKWTGARGYRWIFILYLYGGYATIILCENSLDGFFLKPNSMALYTMYIRRARALRPPNLGDQKREQEEKYKINQYLNYRKKCCKVCCTDITCNGKLLHVMAS